MGKEIDEREYSADDYKQFNRRIHDQVDILKEVIQRPDFGQGERCIGAELEVYLIDEKSDVSPINVELIDAMGDPQFTTELNKYNLEANFSPVKAAGKPFNALTLEMLSKFHILSNAAEKFNTRPLAIGILPTLHHHHLTSEYMTDMGRYRLLNRELLRLRGEPFHIQIEGDSESVDFTTPEICVEGANTSLQVHLMTSVEDFAKTYNAAQLTLPMAVGVAANSSVLFGNCLWDETRVVLFKQSIDNRIRKSTDWRQPSRVTFGHGWMRESAWELFSESVNLFEPIFPELFEEDSSKQTPDLAELNLHMGSIWHWNRVVYDNNGSGHLRIEFRALPAGPTALDMAANAAFSIGMALGLANRVDEYIARIPFRFAEYNFYQAAKHGLDATILWPQKYQNKPVEVPLKNVIHEMLQIADDGLAILNVDRIERDKYLNIIKGRLSHNINGARWTKQTLLHLRNSMDNDKACAEMLNRYFINQMNGAPVSELEKCWK